MKKKAEYSHESAELNAMLGKNVSITLFSGKVITGTLTIAEWKPGRYACGNYSFRKSHVIKAEVL